MLVDGVDARDAMVGPVGTIVEGGWGGFLGTAETGLAMVVGWTGEAVEAGA